MSKVSLNSLVKDGIEPSLDAAGFHNSGKLSWTRETPELSHVIALTAGPPIYELFWGLYEQTAADVVYGGSSTRANPALCVVQGTPATIRTPPALDWLSLDDLRPTEVPFVVEALRRDVQVMAEHTANFQTRRSVWQHLMENRLESDWERDFIIPTSLGLKLVTASALAVADRDPGASKLVAETHDWMIQNGFGDDVKLARLERLAENVSTGEKATDRAALGRETPAGGVLYWKYEEDPPPGADEDQACGPAWIIHPDGSEESIYAGSWIAKREAARIAAARRLGFDDEA